MQEKTFFEDSNVKVTNSRFIVGSQTFAMSSVNSVKVGIKDITPSGGVFVMFGIFGLFVCLASLSGLQNRNYESLAILLPAVVITFLCFFKVNSIKKVFDYSIVLTTSSGETAALKSRDKDYISTIEKALIDSIVHRG